MLTVRRRLGFLHATPAVSSSRTARTLSAHRVRSALCLGTVDDTWYRPVPSLCPAYTSARSCMAAIAVACAAVSMVLMPSSYDESSREVFGRTGRESVCGRDTCGNVRSRIPQPASLAQCSHVAARNRSVSWKRMRLASHSVEVRRRVHDLKRLLVQHCRLPV